jgi:uncharacterized protein with PIN domain
LKFLVDRCAGRRIADWLRTAGHDVKESRELGSDPGDDALLALAEKEERIVVTMDKDFGDLVFAKGAAHCAHYPVAGYPRSLTHIADLAGDRRPERRGTGSIGGNS